MTDTHTRLAAMLAQLVAMTLAMTLAVTLAAVWRCCAAVWR